MAINGHDVPLQRRYRGCRGPTTAVGGRTREATHVISLARTTSFLLSLAAVLVFTACGSQPVKADDAQESGVTGVSVVDAGCPVLRQGENCPDKPMPARLSVTRINSS